MFLFLSRPQVLIWLFCSSEAASFNLSRLRLSDMLKVQKTGKFFLAKAHREPMSAMSLRLVLALVDTTRRMTKARKKLSCFAFGDLDGGGRQSRWEWR